MRLFWKDSSLILKKNKIKIKQSTFPNCDSHSNNCHYLGLGGNAALGGGLSSLLGQSSVGNNLGLNLGGNSLSSLTGNLGGTTSAGGMTFLTHHLQT